MARKTLDHYVETNCGSYDINHSLQKMLMKRMVKTIKVSEQDRNVN